MSGHLTYKLKRLVNDSIYWFSLKVPCIHYHVHFRQREVKKKLVPSKFYIAYFTF